MNNNYSTGLLQIERRAFGTDVVSRLFPCRVRNRAALDYYGESQLLGGGDFFDFVPIEPRGLVVAIGDVSGRTAAASALLLPVLRGFLRTGLPGDPGHIRRVVRDLNRTLCDTSPDSLYATLFCAAIDPELRQLHYVNAGHEAALLVRGAGERVYRLESTGTVLGLTTRSGYGVRTLALEPGDLLVAFSGGVADAANPAGRPFGESGVLQTLRDHPGARSSELVACLVDAVRQFADRAGTADDRTVTVVRLNQLLADPVLEDQVRELTFAAA
jgi:sigma-B regulation protein RsbU (phosphoserine phosphatase)